jgi:hypothetical protein
MISRRVILLIYMIVFKLALPPKYAPASTPHKYFRFGSGHALIIRSGCDRSMIETEKIGEI